MRSIAEQITQGLKELKSLRVVHYKSIGSTNDEAFRLAMEAPEEVLLVISDSQTKGRGRQGKHWYSPEGNLYMSLLLQEGLLKGLRSGDSLQLITLAAGVAVVEAVYSLYDYRASLKWPNDIMAEDRKVGGILTESRIKGSGPSLLVIGVGLNLTPKGINTLSKAASLSEFVNRVISREDLSVAITRSLLQWIGRLCKGAQAELTKEWQQWSSTIGKKVEVTGDGWGFVGIAKSIDSLGRLLVEHEGSNDLLVIGSGSLLYVDS